MNQQTLQEWAALNAVGALDARGREALEALLAASDPAAAQEMSAFNDVAALLALSTSVPRTPPPDLKNKILRKIAETEQPAATKSPAAPPPAAEGFKFVPAAEQGDWQELRVPGAWVKLLSIDPERGYAVVLGKLDAGARYPAHKHIHGEQVYVLTGDLHIGEHRLGPGDYHHADAGTSHGVNYSETGCVILAVISTADLQAQMA